MRFWTLICLGLPLFAVLSCSGGGNSLGSSGGSGGNSQSGAASTPPPAVAVWNNGLQATWSGVNITPRAPGNDTINTTLLTDTVTGGTPSLLLTCVMAGPPSPNYARTFVNMVYGLPPPNTALAYIGVDASRYSNGTISFDVDVLNPLVDHFQVIGGNGGPVTFNCGAASVGIWAHYTIPVSMLYTGTLASLPYALQISFCIVAPTSPFQVQTGFTNGMQIAAMNNLVWTP